jgi:hypothetical protein
LLLYGGFSGGDVNNDLWALDTGPDYNNAIFVYCLFEEIFHGFIGNEIFVFCFFVFIENRHKVVDSNERSYAT